MKHFFDYFLANKVTKLNDEVHSTPIVQQSDCQLTHFFVTNRNQNYIFNFYIRKSNISSKLLFEDSF